LILFCIILVPPNQKPNKMKALLPFMLCCAFLNFNAQDYFNETAEWKQTFYYQNSSGSTVCHDRLYFNGDSIHNGTNYRKLFKDSECIISQMEWDSLGNVSWVSDTNYSTYQTAILREWDKKVFFLDGQGQEYLRYDFGQPDYTNINSVDSYYSCGFETSVQIEAHDTVCIGPIGRKRWHVSWSQYPNASHFIEGVGPTSGFLAPVCRNGCPECGYSLDSFVLNGDTLYQGVCSIPAPVRETKPIAHTVIQTLETLDVRYPGLTGMQFYNCAGQCIDNAKAYEKDRILFDIQSLPVGVYLYQSRVNGALIRGKFAIVNQNR
jgi:hypothetical protein